MKNSENEFLQELSNGPSQQALQVRAHSGAVQEGPGPDLAGGGHLGAQAGRLLIVGGGKFKFKFGSEEGRRYRRRSCDGSGDRAAAPAPPLHRQPAATAAANADGWARLTEVVRSPELRNDLGVINLSV